jgi:aryl-alcohol dehydrogenase-like predicted oxidoreductase
LSISAPLRLQPWTLEDSLGQCRHVRDPIVTRPREITIPIRRFGRTDLNVSAFGLGCARIGGIFKQHPHEFVNLLAAAVDVGINFFDTADMYSQGESETLLGRAFKRRREGVVIATKAGYVLPSRRRFAARLKPLVRPAIRLLGIARHHLPGTVSGALTQDFSPAHLQRSVEGSLRRLATDYLDLFQLHSPPTSVVERGEWVQTLETLKHQGKIRYYGISCDDADAALAALDHGGVSSIQVPINLLERGAIRVLPKAREQGVAVIARECLANGLLAKDLGALDVTSYVRSESEGSDKAAKIALYRQAACENGYTLPEVALQFVSHLTGVSVSLIGVSRLHQLEALLAKGIPHAVGPDRYAIPHFS